MSNNNNDGGGDDFKSAIPDNKIPDEGSLCYIYLIIINTLCIIEPPHSRKPMDI